MAGRERLAGSGAGHLRELTGPLKSRTFRELWAGNLAATFGTMVQTVGASWMMLTLTQSPQMVALVQSCVTLPLVALSLIGGAMADTFDRRRIMLGAQLFMIAASSGLTVLAFFGALTPTLILLFTLLIGCGGAIHVPTWQSSLRDIVERKALPSAVALHSMAFNLMRTIGPAAGGVILTVAGAPVLFLINALSYLPLVGGLLHWRGHQTPPTSGREPLTSALASGLRYSSMSPGLLRVFLRGTVFCFCGVPVQALLPVVAGDLLEGGPELYGILLGSFGVGALVAAFLLPLSRKLLSNEGIVRVAFVALGLSSILLVWGGFVWTAVIAMAVAGCCWVTSNALYNTILQLSTPRWVVGRSLSILYTGLFGGMTLGSWVWGMLAEAQGTQLAITVAGALLIAGAGLGFFLPVPEIPQDDLEPLNRFREPERALSISQRKGPITVTITYRIAPEDVKAFLVAMRLRRRVRRRDGALGWTLMRDVQKPDLWCEFYTVRNWADYIRHNERRTQADASNIDAIRALHQGPDAPEVHRMVAWDSSDPDDRPPMVMPPGVS